MPAVPKAAFHPHLHRAVRRGHDCSIRELLGLFDFDRVHDLDQRQDLVSYLDQAQLVLVPPMSEGDDASPRVLRSKIQDEFTLSEVERIAQLGEQPNIECKSSLMFDIKRSQNDPGKTPNDYRSEAIILSALKTICGFLNRDGGALYIGIAPDGTLCGIETDFPLLRPESRNPDEWLLMAYELIRNRFVDGPTVSNYVQSSIFQDGPVAIAKFQVTPRAAESFVRDKCARPDIVRCYVRQGTSTREIGIEDMPEFVRQRGQ